LNRERALRSTRFRAAFVQPKATLNSTRTPTQASKNTVKTLLDEKQLNAGVQELADQINKTYGDTPLTIVGVLTGSVVLMADLIRKLQMPLRVGVLQTSSYQGTERGRLTLNSEMMLDITGRDVLLIDDIFDTGHTLTEVTQLMNDLGPTSLKSAVLLLKTGCQEVDWRPEFIAFDIPDEFVVGYGLDYNDEYRNLPFLGVLEPADLPGT
jgi:hypoxanthine phosphoribosyltransferase